jgi:hypothetical protein
MDWDAAIEVQRTALQRLLAVMFGVIGAELGGSVDVVTRRVLLLVLRMLGPAESAARRLVFLRARHLPDAEFANGPARDKTKKRGQKKGRAKSRAFPLFDAQRRTRRARRKHPKGAGPNIFFFDGSDTPPAQPKPPVMPYDLVDAAGLCQRLNALFAALGDLDKQAQRLKRIEARRKPNPRFWGEAVVRPDTPPGHRKKGRSDNERAVDKILRECQDLALWWIAECDTS